jgi:hypothetical protein
VTLSYSACTDISGKEVLRFPGWDGLQKWKTLTHANVANEHGTPSYGVTSKAASHESDADSLFCFLALAICTLAKVLRARCGSERLLPFSSVQGFPAAAPHVGQIAVNAGLSIA